MSEALKLKAIRKMMPELEDIDVLGVGSGSTVSLFIKLLAEQSRIRKHTVTVPASNATTSLLKKFRFKISSLDEFQQLDAMVDGTDEITKQLDLMKGGGGALLREKILTSVSKNVMIIADETKIVQRLGDQHPLPIEVLPFAYRTVESRLAEAGFTHVSLRHDKGGRAPSVTDNGNYIIDASLPRRVNLHRLSRELDSIPGLLEHGLFLDIADVAYIGAKRGVKIWKRKQ